jgi:hypothetical protein
MNRARAGVLRHTAVNGSDVTPNTSQRQGQGPGWKTRAEVYKIKLLLMSEHQTKTRYKSTGLIFQITYISFQKRQTHICSPQDVTEYAPTL